MNVSVVPASMLLLAAVPGDSGRALIRWSRRTITMAAEPLTRPIAAMVVSAQSEAFRRTFGSVGSPGPWR